MNILLIPTEMEILINDIEDEGCLVKNEFDINSQHFYDICKKYIQIYSKDKSRQNLTRHY